MAKKSMIARENKREKISEKYSKKMAELTSIVKSIDASDDERDAALIKLSKMPRDASRVRRQRRCQSCGRPHGVYRLFGLCRICLRNSAMQGDVTGLVKSSF